MREIKFRQALYRNGKFYKFRYWGFGLIDEPKERFFMPEISAWEGGDGSIDCLQKPEESMHYTGLKDKNGKEIYEGDIVKREGFSNNDPRKIAWVYWDGLVNGWMIKSNPKDVSVGSLEIKGPAAEPLNQVREVIGNIYSNLELLDAAQGEHPK